MIINDNFKHSNSNSKIINSGVFSKKFKDKISKVDINGFDKILNNNLNPVSLSSNQTKIGFNQIDNKIDGNKGVSLSFYKNKSNKINKQKLDIQLPSRITYEQTETKEDEDKNYLINNNNAILKNQIKISKKDKPFNYNIKHFKILKKKRDQEEEAKNREINTSNIYKENKEINNNKLLNDKDGEERIFNKLKINSQFNIGLHSDKDLNAIIKKEKNNFVKKSIDELIPYISGHLNKSKSELNSNVIIKDKDLNKSTFNEPFKEKRINLNKVESNKDNVIKDISENKNIKSNNGNFVLQKDNLKNDKIKNFDNNHNNLINNYNSKGKKIIRLNSNAISERIKDVKLLNSNNNIIDIKPMTDKLNSDIYDFSFNQQIKFENLKNKKAFIDAPYMFSNVKYDDESNNNNDNNIKLPDIKSKNNLNSKINFKPYTVRQYQEKYEKEEEINKGSLGPNIGSDEWHERNKKMNKLKDYSHSVERKYIKKKVFDKNIYKGNLENNSNELISEKNINLFQNIRNIGSKRSGRSKGSDKSNNSRKFIENKSIINSNNKIQYDKNFLRNSKYNSSQYKFYELDENVKKNMFSKYDSNGRKIIKDDDNNKNFNSVLNYLGINNEDLINEYNNEYNDKFDFNHHENSDYNKESIDNQYIIGKDIEFGNDKFEI